MKWAHSILLGITCRCVLSEGTLRAAHRLKMEARSSWDSEFMKVSGAGYSSTDLETFLSFPFSPLSFCLS